MLKSELSPWKKFQTTKCRATFIQNSHFGNLYSPQGVKNHLFILFELDFENVSTLLYTVVVK